MKQVILMADIIDSGLKNQYQLMNDFNAIVKKVNKTHHKDILSPLTITLGDEFQGVIGNLSSAVNIIISIEEELIHQRLNFKLRYVIYQGEISTPINDKNSYGMLGSGLTESRRILNELKRHKSRFNLVIDNKKQNEIIIKAFLIFENIVDGWDLDKDFETVSEFIKHQDYKKVSEILNKTRSQIWKREKTLNIESYNSIKKIIQEVSKQMK